MVPMEPPTLTIFVEASSEESVVTTRLRAIGKRTSPRLRKGWPQRIDAVGLDGGDGAGGVDRGVAGDQHHSGHVAGSEMLVVGVRRGGAALRGDEAVALRFRARTVAACRLKAGEDQRRVDRLQRGAGRANRCATRCHVLQSDFSCERCDCDEFVRSEYVGANLLWLEFVRTARVVCGALLGTDGFRIVFDRGDAGDGFFGEDAQFQGERAGEFAVEVDGAAAHAGDHAGVFDFWAFELHQDDGLRGPRKLGMTPMTSRSNFSTWSPAKIV